MNQAPTLRQPTIEKLQDLIEVNIDTVRGLQAAAESVEDPVLRVGFMNLAAKRQTFVNELSQFVEGNAEDPPSSGSVAGVAHQLWLQVRAMLDDGDFAVLDELERSELAIRAAYDRVVEETIGSPIHDVLVRQEDSVNAVHALIADLRAVEAKAG